MDAKLKVLMFGWELPPYNSGGLGVACLGLARALAKRNVDIRFVLPKKVDVDYNFMDITFANIKETTDLKSSYTTSMLERTESAEDLPSDFVRAALAFGEKALDLAKKMECDVIHSHDWLSFPAGVAAKEVLGKPLITHVHSTEFDRTGGHYPNRRVYEIERDGLIAADRVISLSQLQRDILINNYGLDRNKIEIVTNGIEKVKEERLPPALVPLKQMGYKIVLYLGRITLHKGPEYFIRAAAKVLQFNPKAIFVIVGSGDMQEYMMNEAARMGIIDKVVFTGFLRGEEKNRVWQSADVYVMPSVSEPFGLTALESISNETPVILSKQSGVAEVLDNALKVDFWDTDEIANKILAVLEYPSLGRDLRKEGIRELSNISWDDSADKCIGIYKRLVK
ncbi:MAG: glycosyltransferase family 4 protein [Candidatus Woesebacteria bacterium]|jgi:glycosyltransferase involved in cell wall biosynthesis